MPGRQSRPRNSYRFLQRHARLRALAEPPRRTGTTSQPDPPNRRLEMRSRDTCRTGRASCRNCHDQDRIKNRGYSLEERAEKICRMTELQFYDNGDRHQIAYTRLANSEPAT